MNMHKVTLLFCSVSMLLLQMSLAKSMLFGDHIISAFFAGKSPGCQSEEEFAILVAAGGWRSAGLPVCLPSIRFQVAWRHVSAQLCVRSSFKTLVHFDWLNALGKSHRSQGALLWSLSRWLSSVCVYSRASASGADLKLEAFWGGKLSWLPTLESWRRLGSEEGISNGTEAS